MSQRFPPLAFDDANSPISELDAEIVKAFGDQSSKFDYKDKEGAPIGPFAVFAYTPDLFQPYSTFASSILNQKDFSPKERELIVLAVTAVHELPYVLYAHERLALNIGMTKEQVALASKGVQPTGLTDEEKVVYVTALELAETKTSLNEGTWGRAEATLGKARCARLAHVVGLHLYTGSLLRIGNIPAPEI